MIALIRASLHDYDVQSVKSIKDADELISKFRFDAALIDIELPDGNGLHFYSRALLNSQFKSTPTLFLTGNNETTNKLIAFSMGADDFLQKPFDPLELNARISSKIKKFRSLQDQSNTRSVGNLEIDFALQKVIKTDSENNHEILLTGHEFKILALLSKRMEQVYSRSQILQEVWGDTFITDRTVDSHIAHLRQKLNGTTVQIDTVKGTGYRLLVRNSS